MIDDELFPQTGFSSVRVKQDIFARSSVGGMFLNKAPAEEGGSSQLAVTDVNLAVTTNTTIHAFMAKSRTPGLVGPDHAAAVHAEWVTDGASVFGDYVDIGDDFNAEIGFVPRTGIRKVRAQTFWSPRPGKLGIRQIFLGNNHVYITDRDGNLESLVCARLAKNYQQAHDSLVARSYAISDRAGHAAGRHVMRARLCSVGLAVGILCALTTGCAAPPQKGKSIHNYEPVDDAFGYVIELEQGWTDGTQQSFYNTPQGSEIMPYSWLLALEQANSEARFIEHENVERYRYISRKASTGNPDALPLGWTKGKDSTGKEWFGLSCSACHTAQIEHVIPETKQLVAIRIDGAPTLADFNLMNLELVEALQRTVSDADKFDRFAAAVLPKGAASNTKEALKGEIESQTDALDTRNKINQTEVHYGFGRIDAIGFILNQVMSTLPGMPQNAKPADAPASYPFLWGTDQSSVVQWTGFAANASGAGVLIRNGGEVIGVYGKVQLSESDTYASSMLIEKPRQARKLGTRTKLATVAAGCLSQDRCRTGCQGRSFIRSPVRPVPPSDSTKRSDQDCVQGSDHSYR